MATTLVFLPGKSHGLRSLVGYRPWGSQRDGHDWAQTRPPRCEVKFSVLFSFNICLLNFLAGAWETLSINLVQSFRGIICFPNCKRILYFFFSIVMVQRIKNLPAMQETWIGSLGQKDPLDKGMATHSIFLPGESHGQRSLEGYSLWGHKESDTTEVT